jgi:hypothetical protein
VTFTIFLLFGCSPKADDTGLGCSNAMSRTYLIEEINYARLENGASFGFDLDSRISDSEDPLGCYREDFVDPTGQLGIDNAFSDVIASLGASEAGYIEDAMNIGISNGDLLMLLEVQGIDDLRNDSCVDVRFVYGHGAPLLSSEGTILDGQSYKEDQSRTGHSFRSAEIVDGSLLLTPISIHLQTEIMAIPISQTLRSGALRMEFKEDDGISGVFGGGMSVEDAFQLASFDRVGFTEHLEYQLANSADLTPAANGRCENISINYVFEGREAHIYSP